VGLKIGDLITGLTRDINPKDLKGKRLGIDAFNVIYQFLARIRDVDTGGMQFTDRNGNITSHLMGLFSRTSFMLLNDMKPLYVFDGEPPDFKKKEIARRREVKVKAAEKQAEALKRGDMAEAAKHAQATSRITPQVLEDAKRLLELMGVPYITAKSEAEAEIAVLVAEKTLYAACSQDYDALLFGSPRIIRNLSVSQRRKIPNVNRYIPQPPVMVETAKVLKGLDISREQLVLMALMVGTDFGPGVKGIGPKTALKIVKKNPTLNSVIDHLRTVYLDTEEKFNEAFPNDPLEIHHFFMNPPHTGMKDFSWNKIDADGIMSFLCGERDFNEERILSNVKKLKEKQQQTSLMSFF